jgi:carbamate kinase
VTAPSLQLVVVALGGNALLRRGEPLEARLQQANIDRASAAIAKLAANYDIVVTHGNGPQVGLLALQTAAYKKVKPYPLDVLGAESEGMIGYLLEQSLRNALRGPAIATLLTQVVVDPDDPAFEHPTKPVGPIYDEPEAKRVPRELGWTVADRGGGSFRRVVASPEPQEIVELPTIKLLVDAGVLVICGGGGGIPVVTNGNGTHHGVEAVVDKDLSAALLAAHLGADILLMLTDVPAVEQDWGTPRARPIARTTPRELRKFRFQPGSMEPKVEAACRFVENCGGIAAIGSLEQAAAIIDGHAGTRVENC